MSPNRARMAHEQEPGASSPWPLLRLRLMDVLGALLRLLGRL